MQVYNTFFKILYKQTGCSFIQNTIEATAGGYRRKSTSDTLSRRALNLYVEVYPLTNGLNKM